MMKRSMARFGAAALLAGVSLLLLTPLSVSAHSISGAPTVNCVNATVSVTVTNWTGNVEIKKQPSGLPITEQMPAGPNSTVVFGIASIGGNGVYTVGRQGNPTDPTPVLFTVACSTPTPIPTATATATPTASPTATPSSSPTGSVNAINTTPTATPTGGVLGISVPSTGSASPGSLLLVGSLVMLSMGVTLVALGRRSAHIDR
jgi:uncharacterized surface anchored protein